MKVVAAVLTTFDRPRLLRQSLPETIRQCQEVRLPLWIFDDASTDHDTLEQLEQARHAEGVEVFMRGEPDGLHAHLSTGRLFIKALMQLTGKFGTSAAFLKLDDDIVLEETGIARLVDGWAWLWRSGLAPAAISGIATPHTQILEAW